MNALVDMFTTVLQQKGIVGALILAMHIAVGAGSVLWLFIVIVKRLARATLRGIRQSRTRRFLKLHHGYGLDGHYRDPAVYRLTHPVHPSNGGPDAA